MLMCWTISLKRYEGSILEADLVRRLTQGVGLDHSDFDNVTSTKTNKTFVYPGFTRYFRNGTRPSQAGVYFAECAEVYIVYEYLPS